MTQLKIDSLIGVDFDKPLVCEVAWLDEKKNHINECTNLATWVALTHDEITKHDYQTTLMCGECVILVNYKNNCPDCGTPLMTNLRKL